MSQLIKFFVGSGQEENESFQLIPAIVTSLLVLSFQAAIVYVLISTVLQP